MKKSNYAALVFGAISVLMLGLGMSMALLPEWNMFTPGVVIGVAGLIVALVGVFVWRSMENKQPIQWNSKAIMTIMVGVLGAFALGLGMCFIMLWGNIC